ncbi:MAG: SemiSWEET family transporter [Patescibacteria group bacterium]|nr:SemiSWEET family transporter [Patescibacteria group bacterium]
MIETSVAIVASVLTAFQLIPQTIKIVREKNSKGISRTTFRMITLSSSLWLIHGVNRLDFAIIFANSITFICAVTVLSLHSKNKKKPSGNAARHSN